MQPVMMHVVTVYRSTDPTVVLYTRRAKTKIEALGFARLALDGADRGGWAMRVEIAEQGSNTGPWWQETRNARVAA